MSYNLDFDVRGSAVCVKSVDLSVRRVRTTPSCATEIARRPSLVHIRPVL